MPCLWELCLHGESSDSEALYYIRSGIYTSPGLGSPCKHSSYWAIGYLSSPNSTICKAFPFFLKPRNYSGAALPIKL